MPSTEQLLNEWVSWLTETGGLSPAEAEEYRAVILDFQRCAGIPELTKATTENIERYLKETDLEDFELDVTRGLERADITEIECDDLRWLSREVRRTRKQIRSCEA